MVVSVQHAHFMPQSLQYFAQRVALEYPAVIPLQRLGQYAYFHRNRLMNRPAARRNRVWRGSFVRRSISRKKFSFPKLSKKHSLCEGMGTQISIT